MKITRAELTVVKPQVIDLTNHVWDKVDLPKDLLLTYEDLYFIKNTYEDNQGILHEGFWTYEQIRNEKRSGGIMEFLTMIHYHPANDEGRIEMSYQTVGNGFMLWHRFRIKDHNFMDNNKPAVEEMRYQADKIIDLYLHKKG